MVPFGVASFPRDAFEVVRAHLLVRSGRAAEVLALPPPAPDAPLYPLKLVVFGDAWMATGQLDAAVRAYRGASESYPRESQGANEVHDRLAEALEKAAQIERAAEEEASQSVELEEVES